MKNIHAGSPLRVNSDGLAPGKEVEFGNLLLLLDHMHFEPLGQKEVLNALGGLTHWPKVVLKWINLQLDLMLIKLLLDMIREMVLDQLPIGVIEMLGLIKYIVLMQLLNQVGKTLAILLGAHIDQVVR